ncbi:MAG TPA: TA system VapC family ribonuclease toxin [Tepidisphaeraceae bacterium]|nr:TA system VapC family ribonuclease toxin [Tepidisphaeraceae bacterium]
MPVHLLDANVLIALGWPTHAHHAVAHRWFASAAAADGWATCPLTQLGFVRVSTNPRAVGAALAPSQAGPRVRGSLAVARVLGTSDTRA